MQQIFNLRTVLASLLIASPVLALHGWAKQQPTRVARADRTVTGIALALPSVRIGERNMLMQSWLLAAPDPRLGGISGLAVDRGALLAITDEGVAIRFDPPKSGTGAVRFAFHDLPEGPGRPAYKRGRDAEAVMAARAGGYWVSFEGYDALWRYDRAFTRVVERTTLDVAWPSNTGGEAIVQARDGAVMVLPEGGGKAVAVNGRGVVMIVPRGTSDAVRLPDGRVALLGRRLSPFGFRSKVRIEGRRGEWASTIALPLAALDNPEAIAAAPLPNGGTRLWIATDDNFRPWMRTLLIAIDLPPGA